jgi:hypothetical protein
MDKELINEIEKLLQGWDDLADEARHKGASDRERYYFGIAIGLEAAKADMTRILKKARRHNRRGSAASSKA